MLAGIGIGPVRIPPDVALAIVLSKAGLDVPTVVSQQQEVVLWIIRLPRVLLAALVGAALAVSGALLQAIFRNPLADPGLIGVSGGAAMGAIAVMVIGILPFGRLTLPLVAFLCGTGTTLLVYRFSKQAGRTDIATMLLVGLAINAIAGAITGLLTYVAEDDEVRSIVFWTMGGLSGALWNTLAGVVPAVMLVLLLAPLLARPLNLFALGEAEAHHLGVETERIKRLAIVLAALATGASVAVAGPISFIGLIVPHIVRLLAGADHRRVLPACAIGGAGLLILADLVARTVAQPAEVPVGLITALAGGPFFLILIIKSRRRGGAGI
jgi:iron complex transport system permease protein